ncbi:MAG: YdeI/OmpD-associated family protein [Flavobacteriia bacterium]|nr:YdeI/OmpD-associated family protein [Flavobacteriia bacterium]
MKDNRIDIYIGKSAEFAQPILNYLRKLIHEICPEVNETIKWGFPHFEYKKSILCSFASFKQHCSFGFWLGSLMIDSDKVFQKVADAGMGQFGKLTSLSDLPAQKILKSYLLQAMTLIDNGAKLTKSPIKKETKELEIPFILSEALNQNDKAKATFDNFSYSNKKEYIEWINDAKTETTKIKRLETTMEWLKEGKTRNWKYIKC